MYFVSPKTRVKQIKLAIRNSVLSGKAQSITYQTPLAKLILLDSKTGKIHLLFSLPEQQHYSPGELQQTPTTAISPESNKGNACCKEQQTLQAKHND